MSLLLYVPKLKERRLKEREAREKAETIKLLSYSAIVVGLLVKL